MSMFGTGLVMMGMEMLYASSTRDEIFESFGEPDESWVDAEGREVWVFQKHGTALGMKYVFIIEDGVVIRCHICASGMPFDDQESDVELAGDDGVSLTPKSEQAKRQRASDPEPLLLPDDLWWIIRVAEPYSGRWFRDLQPTRGLRERLLEGKVVKIERGFFLSPEEAMEAWNPIGRLRRGAIRQVHEP